MRTSLLLLGLGVTLVGRPALGDGAPAPAPARPAPSTPTPTPTKGADRSAVGLPTCGATAGAPSYPCLGPHGLVLSLGPFGGYRSQGGVSRGHTGLEASLLTGRVVESGGHADLRSWTYGGVLDLGYLSSPNAFRASLEGEVLYPVGVHRMPTILRVLLGWVGVTFGPSLTVDAASTRAGISGSLWTGFILFAYGRLGADFPWAPYWEVGGYLKLALPLKRVNPF